MSATTDVSTKAPLVDAGLTKAEIRELSRIAELPTWDRPASACLSSRFPYGTPITLELLRQVDRAEQAVHDAGLRSCRVRHQGRSKREIGVAASTVCGAGAASLSNNSRTAARQRRRMGRMIGESVEDRSASL